MATHTQQLTRQHTVQLRGLTRSFEGRTVLDNIDLDLPAGQFTALLGHSGSGKSTLLRAIAGLDHNVAGSGRLTAPERVSVVFQDSRLLPWRRVLDNVLLGTDGKEAAEKGRSALAEVGLAGRERAWPNELSGGEAQRAALARSLVREPELLLADEPFGALDALTRIRMHVLLRELWERHRPSVLLVTHDVDEAIVLADRVLVLDRGRIGVDLTIDRPHPRSYRDPRLGEYRERLLSALGVTEDVTGGPEGADGGATEHAAAEHTVAEPDGPAGHPVAGRDATADDTAGHGVPAHQEEKHS
ncbi:ABC transporter ATP-binding protein [Streptomyces sp. NPDC006446]|uniref:ABC transporter ATP-binding protein n=1 Tax=Streptomyces sp. NPDC006446 TaxID=3154301 RepID=UPI0033A1E8B8